MSDCINLKEHFGSTYRLDVDESYFATTGAKKNCCLDPWLYQLRGSCGHICPWGGELLAVCLDPGQTKPAKRLMKEPWVIEHASQIGDNGEVNAVFHVDHIEEAAVYARLYRRPQLSVEERQRRGDQMHQLRGSPIDSKF